MKKFRLLFMGVMLIFLIGLFALKHGVFGHFSDERPELIGFVAKDGTWLDLDGNPVENTEVEKDVLHQAILEEQEAMRNITVFGINILEIEQIVETLKISDIFEVNFRSPDTIYPTEITIIMNDIENPFAYPDVLLEFEKIVMTILSLIGLTYSQETIEELILDVVGTTARISQINYNENIVFIFFSHDGNSGFTFATL